MIKKLVYAGIAFCLLLLLISSPFSADWEKHVIGDQSSPIYLFVKDMDGDSDPDVASTTNRHPLKWNSEIAWFRNNLNQRREWDTYIVSPATPEEKPITNTNGIAVADIDKDGLEDIVVGTGMVSNRIGSVHWFKAPIEPTGKWQRHDIEVGAANSYFKIYTMDINNDTMEDIIVGGRQGAVLFVNPGDPIKAGATWEKITFPEGMGGSFYLDDLSGDGKTDLLNSNSKGHVSWVRVACEDGKIIFDQTVIDDDLERAFDINCMDINGDDKKDVIVTVLNQPHIYWYEAPVNKGDPWIQHVLSDSFSGTDIYAGDINRDRKTDLVVSGAFVDQLVWFEYRSAGGHILWTEHMIDDNINDPGDVSLNDMDSDGDLDVVVTGLREDQMLWYENKI